MAGINELVQRLERYAQSELQAKIASKVRDAMHQACIDGFNEKRDPYGTQWAPRKPVKAWAVRAFGLIDTNHPLLDYTGKMIGSLATRALQNGVVMRILGYARFHQFGTSKMVARLLFPDPARGLGQWADPVHRAAVEAVKELMR